ncbi:hypothetical protein Pfo_023080 [Paulownia fortunei]|nr:hypothetical protein Pfo_023080 [Paulownia fortunei]
MSLGYAEKLSFIEDLGNVGMTESFDPLPLIIPLCRRACPQLNLDPCFFMQSKHLVFTGAGISTSCGIHPKTRKFKENRTEISPYQCSDDEDEDGNELPIKKYIPSWASVVSDPIPRLVVLSIIFCPRILAKFEILK